jgi:cold shock CspA family protein
MGKQGGDQLPLEAQLSQGDAKLDAQFWTARHNFLYGDRQVALTMFRLLEKTWIPAKYPNAVKGTVRERDGSEKWFVGSIKRIDDNHCYIVSPDLNCDIFAHGSDFAAEDWKRIAGGTPVFFVLGFSFGGARAKRIRLKADWLDGASARFYQALRASF